MTPFFGPKSLMSLLQTVSGSRWDGSCGPRFSRAPRAGGAAVARPLLVRAGGRPGPAKGGQREGTGRGRPASRKATRGLGERRIPSRSLAGWFVRVYLTAARAGRGIRTVRPVRLLREGRPRSSSRTAPLGSAGRSEQGYLSSRGRGRARLSRQRDAGSSPEGPWWAEPALVGSCPRPRSVSPRVRGHLPSVRLLPRRSRAGQQNRDSNRSSSVISLVPVAKGINPALGNPAPQAAASPMLV